MCCRTRHLNAVVSDDKSLTTTCAVVWRSHARTDSRMTGFSASSCLLWGVFFFTWFWRISANAFHCFILNAKKGLYKLCALCTLQEVSYVVWRHTGELWWPVHVWWRPCVWCFGLKQLCFILILGKYARRNKWGSNPFLPFLEMGNYIRCYIIFDWINVSEKAQFWLCTFN